MKRRKKATKKTTKKITITSPLIARHVLAGLLLMLLLLQLFTFESFPQLISANTGLSEVLSRVVAVGLVVAELLALPALLVMKTSKKLETASMVCLSLSLLALTCLTIANLAKGYQAVIWGATFELPSGYWLVSFLLILWILFGWGFIDRFPKLTKHQDLRSKNKQKP